MDVKKINLERTMMSKHIEDTNKRLPFRVKFPSEEVAKSFINTHQKAVQFFDKETYLYKRYSKQIKEIFLRILPNILKPELIKKNCDFSFTFVDGVNIFNTGYIIDDQFCCLYCIQFEVERSHIVVTKIKVGVDKMAVALVPIQFSDVKTIAYDSMRRLNAKYICAPPIVRTNTEFNDPSFYDNIETNTYKPPLIKKNTSFSKITCS